jgi:hypothetical protein
MQRLVQELLLQRCPGMAAHEAQVHAVLSVVSVHAALDHIQSMAEPMRPVICSALVDMMVRYFTPIEARYPRPTPP